MIQKTHVIQSSTTDIGSSTLALAPECTTDQAKTWLCRAAFRCCVRGESWKDQGSCNVSCTVSVFPKICIQWLQVCSEKRLVQSACSTLSTHGLLEGSTESTTDIEGSGESKIEINGCHSRKEGESKTGIAFALGGVLGAAHENDMPKSHFVETECTAKCRLETKRKNPVSKLEGSMLKPKIAWVFRPSIHISISFMFSCAKVQHPDRTHQPIIYTHVLLEH